MVRDTLIVERVNTPDRKGSMPLLYPDGSPCFSNSHKATDTPTFLCNTCGYVGAAFGEGTGNFGQDFTGGTHCKACCRDRDADAMEVDKRLCSYLASDGSTIGTWHGLPLMRCLSCTLHRKSRNGCDVYNLRARDNKGRLWVGRGGGKGMYCNLRLAKVQA